MSKKGNNKKERRGDSHPSPKMVTATALLKFCGTPLNNLTKWIPLLIVVSITIDPVADVLIAWAEPVSNALQAFAGENTSLQANIHADINSPRNNDAPPGDAINCSVCNVYLIWISIVSITVTFGAMLLIVRERRLRRKTIENFEARKRKLESMIDSDRSSSGLTTRGDTHPKDA